MIEPRVDRRLGLLALDLPCLLLLGLGRLRSRPRRRQIDAVPRVWRRRDAMGVGVDEPVDRRREPIADTGVELTGREAPPGAPMQQGNRAAITVSGRGHEHMVDRLCEDWMKVAS